MVSPETVVGDVHAGFAFAGGLGVRAVHVDGGAIEERLGLFGPDFEPGRVDGVLEGINVWPSEASAEVAGSGGIGDAAGTEQVEEGVVVAAEVDVLEAGALTECVVGKVENVVGFVIGKVDFEQMKSLVDGLWQTELLDECVDGTDAAVDDGVVAVGNVVVDVGRGEDGSVGGDIVLRIQSPFDSGLEFLEPGAEDGFHSKSLVGVGASVCGYLLTPRKRLRISSFSEIDAKEMLRSRLVKV